MQKNRDKYRVDGVKGLRGEKSSGVMKTLKRDERIGDSEEGIEEYRWGLVHDEEGEEMM